MNSDEAAHSLHTAGMLVASSFILYAVFKGREPTNPRIVVLLLLGFPTMIFYEIRSRFHSTIFGLAISYVISWFMILACTVLYRVSPFHPLAKFPGPLSCKISKSWLAYVTMPGKSYEYIYGLHQRYGDIVRIGPNELSVTHKDLAISVMSLKGFPRGPYFDTRQHEAGISVDGIRDFAEHAARRRPWTRAMNVPAINCYTDTMKDKIRELIDVFRQKEGTPVDLAAWLNVFGFEFMGQMALSTDFGMLRQEKDTIEKDTIGIMDLIHRALKELAWISHVPWVIPFLKLFPQAKESWDELKDVCEKTVMTRIEGGSNKPDLIHHLMDEGKHESARPDPLNVSIDGTLAIGAGADTAASAISNLWYFLLRHPTYYKRLRAEVDHTFPMGTDCMDLSSQASMPHLNACINETLRVLPPILGGLQRRVERDTGGKMVGPYLITEDTQVTPWPYAVHRDSNNFSPIPEVFWPDRWLTQDNYVLPSGEIISADQVITTREVFMPFSLGPYICAGKPLAIIELRAVVCALVQQCDVQVADGFDLETWSKNLREVFSTSRGKLEVVMTMRRA